MFRARTESIHIAQWWGPTGFRTTIYEMEVRPGGSFLYSMRMANAPEIWGKFVYREIKPPDRLVFLSSVSDADGNPTRHPFSPPWPLEILNTVTFAEKFGKTRLRLLSNPNNATPEELKTPVYNILC